MVILHIEYFNYSDFINNKQIYQNMNQRQSGLDKNIISSSSPEQQQQILPAWKQSLTNPEILRLNQQITQKINEGRISVIQKQQIKQNKNDQTFERVNKHKKLEKIFKEKQDLEKRLQSINHSIYQIKQSDSNKRLSDEKNSRIKSLSPEEIRQLKAKNQTIAMKIRQDRASIQKKKEEVLKKIENQRNKQQQFNLKKQQDERSKKRQEIYQNMIKMKERIALRQEQNKKNNQKYKQVCQEKTLFKKYEENYKERQNSVLQDRKRRLAKIRSIHKPIDLKQIEEHQKKFISMKKQIESIKSSEKKMNERYTPDYHVSFKGSYYLKCQKQQKSEQNDEQSRIKANKMKQFSNHIRDNFVPHIDQKKRQAIERLLEIQQSQKKQKDQMKEKQMAIARQIKASGLRYLEQLRNLPKKHKQEIKQPETQRIQYQNYLTHTDHSQDIHWNQIMKSKKSKKQKAIKMYYQSQKFEKILKQKQQKNKLLKMNNEEQLDNQYFEMVKAKLSLFQN